MTDKHPPTPDEIAAIRALTVPKQTPSGPACQECLTLDGLHSILCRVPIIKTLLAAVDQQAKTISQLESRITGLKAAETAWRSLYTNAR